MNNFGEIKTKILGKLTESYSSNNKKEIKEILKLIKTDKDFKDLYLFYEEIENMSFSKTGSAELYLEIVEPLFIEKTEKVKKTIKKISSLLENIDVENNELYNLLDVISEKTSLKNLDKKINAKKELLEHLKTEKHINEDQTPTYITNENLLYSVLANNFNVLYNDTLNESQKNELKSILSLTNEELNIRANELKEGVLNTVDNLLAESTEDILLTKLNSVKDEVRDMTISKYNYYKLLQLKDGLN
jgi:hypothetical protein